MFFFFSFFFTAICVFSVPSGFFSFSCSCVCVCVCVFVEIHVSVVSAGKFYSPLDGPDLNYGEDPNMAMALGLGGMAGLGNESND